MDIKVSKYLNGAKGALTFTFDDGCYGESTLKTIEIFKEVEKLSGVKIKATSAQTVGFVSPSMIEIWKNAISEGYYDVCSHSVDHCLAYNDETPEEKRLEDAEKSRERLAEIYGEKPICFAIPGGGESAGACELLSKHYYANRVGEGPINDPDTCNFMRLTSFIGRFAYEDAEPCKKFIDEVVSTNGWGIQINHWLSEKEQDIHHAQKLGVFRDECVYASSLAKDGTLWIASLNDAVNYFLERKNAQISTQGDEICVSHTLDKNIFNMPLTLVVTTDEDKKITVNGTPFDVKANQENIITVEI
jgi:hypothetical protein